MTMLRRLLLLIMFPALVFAQDYPGAIYDHSGTKRDGTWTQAEMNAVADEVEAIETELGANFRAHGPRSLIRDGSVENWAAGTSSAPDGWTLSGTGAAVARQSDGQDGTYSAQITAGSAASKLEQTALTTISAAVNTRLRGTPVTLIAMVKSSASSACRLQVNDGVGSSESSYHTGGGTWERLSVTRALDASATTLVARLLNDATDSSTTCRYDSAVLVEGKFPWAAFHESTTVRTGGGDGRASLSGVFCASSTQVCTGANTTETDLHSCTLPANALGSGVRGVRVYTWGTTGANGNTKTIRIYFGGTELTNINTTNNNAAWRMVAHVLDKDGASNQTSIVERYTGTSNSADVTGSPAISETGTIIVKTTGQNGTSSANDICARAFVLEFIN